jgi:hypothetical protein
MYGMSEKKKQITHKQHWLPVASHLDQFANSDGVVQVYRYTSKGKDMLKTAKHFSVSPNAIGYENDLYERDDLPTNTVEDNLAVIEAEFGKVLENKIKKHKPLTDKDRMAVAQYIGLLQFRTPRHRAHLNESFQRMEDMGRQIALANGHPEAGDRFADEVRDAGKAMFTEAMAIAQDVNIWWHLDYCFLEIADDYMAETEFITSDHPVSLLDFTMSNSPYGLHPWHKTAESVVPLTPKLALFGNRVGITGYKKVDYNFLREVNFRTVSASNQMVISHEPIQEYEQQVIIDRFPQSLILHYLELPDGRADAILKDTEKPSK